MSATSSRALPWSPLVGVVWSIVIFFVAQTIAGIVIGLYPLLRGWDSRQGQQWFESGITAQFWFVLFAQALTVTGLLLFMRWHVSRPRKPKVSLRQVLRSIGVTKPKFKHLGAALIAYPLYFITYGIIFVLVDTLIPGIDTAQKQELGFDNVIGPLALTLTFISLVVLPPLVEEFMSRGVIYSSIRSRYKFVVAALITSVLFAIAHLPAGGAAGPLYIAAIDTFVLSMILCFLREKSGSLWPGIYLHAAKNGVAFLALFIFVI